MLTVGLAVDTTIEAKGDPVGTPVGFRGAFDGDWLGLEVGCGDVKVESKKYHVRYPQEVKIYATHIHNRSLPLLMASSLAPPLGSAEPWRETD